MSTPAAAAEQTLHEAPIRGLRVIGGAEAATRPPHDALRVTPTHELYRPAWSRAVRPQQPSMHAPGERDAWEQRHNGAHAVLQGVGECDL